MHGVSGYNAKLLTPGTEASLPDTKKVIEMAWTTSQTE